MPSTTSWCGTRKPGARSARPMLEALEDRSLPSAAPVAAAVPTALVALPPQPAPLVNLSPIAGPAFVDTIYADLLGRHAEPAGMSYWLGVLRTQGQVSVAQGIMSSPEYRTLEVQNYYQTFLGRTGSTSEVTGWVEAFEAGATEQQVILAFVTSSEFGALHPSSGSYVTALYRGILGRDPEATALASWETQIDSGLQTREQVAQAILNSPEALGDVVSAFYGAFLHRTPSSMEVGNWLDLLAHDNDQLDAVAVGILTSPEFHQGLPTSIR